MEHDECEEQNSSNEFEDDRRSQDGESDWEMAGDSDGGEWVDPF